VERVLAIAAHPDDIEFVMAGTLFLLRGRGWEVHYLTIADGGCGSAAEDAATTAARREKEARAAAAHLDAVFHESLCRDAEIVYEVGLLRRLAAIVRRIAPRILLAHSPQDYMEDHEQAARLAASAAFVRGMRNFATDPPVAPLDGEIAVYHAQPHGNRDALGEIVRPTLCVDIEPVMEKKAAMLAEHASQREWLDRSQGLGSYVDAMRRAALEVGELSGRHRFAEGWRRHNPLGFCAPENDFLAEALGRSAERGSASPRSPIR
jgi:LmbE family N-acetylglucosaminyl deacetylase